MAERIILRLWNSPVPGLILIVVFCALFATLYGALIPDRPRPPKTPTPAIWNTVEDEDEDERYDESCGRTGCYGSDG